MNLSTQNSHGPGARPRQQNHSQREWNRQHYKAALLTVGTIVACGILLAVAPSLPKRYLGITLSIGPAIYMTGFLVLFPNSLRSRSGSLVLAVLLVTFLWIVGLVCSAAFFAGIIE